MNRYPMFNPQVLISFVAVCETLSFTRGADRVSLSQSTVSLQVKRLEDLLGCPLLERSSHQVQLTEEGERLLSYARRIIALNEEAHDALTGAWRDGVLRLGMPEDFAVPTIDLLAEFSREHPHLRLDVSSGLSADLRAAYAISQRFQIYGRVENLFDEQYQTVLTYGTPGRAAYAGVRARF